MTVFAVALAAAQLGKPPTAPKNVQVLGPGRLTGVGLTVTITVPTSAATYDASTATSITVSGTAQSDRIINIPCTWTNSLGGSGSTSGTTSWTVASLPLTVGSNVVTVTCTNTEGTSAQDIVTVTASSAGSCAGTCYYVRPDGNNSNTGLTNTAGGAWLTIDKCADTAVAGDTCRVQAGSYAEVVTPSHNGSSGNPITIVADGVVNTCRFSFTANSWIRVIGFVMDTDLGACTIFRANVIGDGTNTGLEFWNNDLSNTNGEVINFAGSLANDRCHDCIFFGNTMHGLTGANCVGSCVASIVRGNYSIFAYNEIYGINPDANVIDGTHSRWLNLYVHDMIDGFGGHSDIFQAGSSTLGLSFNLIEGIYQKGTGTGGDEHSAQMSNVSGGGTMTENIWRRNVWWNLANGTGPGINQTSGGAISDTRYYHNSGVIGNVLCGSCRQDIAWFNSTNPPGGWVINNLHYDHMHGNASTLNVQVYTVDGPLVANYNLAYDPAKTLSFVSPWTLQANAQSNVNPNLVNAATGDVHLGAGSGDGLAARGTGGPLTTATSCSGTTLNVASNTGGLFVPDDSANVPQYGGALVPGDQVTVNSTTRRIVSISSDAITVDSSVTCSNGDGVYWGDDTTPDIGAYPYKAGGYTLSATYAGSPTITVTPNDASLVRFVVCYTSGVPYAIDNATPFTCTAPSSGTFSARVYPRYASQTLWAVATP